MTTDYYFTVAKLLTIILTVVELTSLAKNHYIFRLTTVDNTRYAGYPDMQKHVTVTMTAYTAAVMLTSCCKYFWQAAHFAA